MTVSMPFFTKPTIDQLHFIYQISCQYDKWLNHKNTRSQTQACALHIRHFLFCEELKSDSSCTATAQWLGQVWRLRALVNSLYMVETAVAGQPELRVFFRVQISTQ
jgi:hypothetical protein